MASNLMLHHIFSTLFILALFLEFPLAECKNNGFTTNLIRRDYPQKSTTDLDDVSSSKSQYFEWLARSFNRSLSRAAHLTNVISKKSSLQTSRIIESPLTGLGGEYVMEVGIGTPPVKVVAIADTGSDVTWTQCKPCINCYKQNDPFFNPKNTSTYRQLSCESQQCQILEQTICDESNKCSYQLGYGDGSQSLGDLAVDTFTFNSNNGKNVSFPKTAFGCGHDNSGNFNETASGIVGLGRGFLSIVNQFSSTISKKFSYCLVPIDKSSSSKISFGVDALPRGSKAVSTPILKGEIDTYYFITLNGISVGRSNNSDVFTSRRQTPPPSIQEGNIIIDSGTTLNLLPQLIYADLRASLVDVIKARPAKDPQGIFDLCYKYGSNLEFPDLVFHFTDADVVIPQENAFLEVSEGLICLTMLPARSNIAILGNLSQMNFLIEYDIENEKLSFLPTDCTKEQ